MSRQCRDIYWSVSAQVSHILDNVGYSQEDRNRKVHFANVCEVFSNIGNVHKSGRWHMFGSRSEGSTGPGLQSDQDILAYNLEILVVSDLYQYQPGKVNFLMVKDNHTHPGYVKLQPIVILPDDTLFPVYTCRETERSLNVDKFNRIVLDNTFVYKNHVGTISGPAAHLSSFNTNTKQLGRDIVTAFISSWPKEDQQFFLRHRRNGWPTTIQMENTRKYGCFVTPVGHPESEECNIEWRLSFSIAEREMIRSFNDPTMKVYLLLKMIKKTYIEPFIGDAFSSYHCKVCMLWMKELLPSEIWRTENILECLLRCIRQLYEWSTTGFCPDYFITQNNIYDRKITGVVRNNLQQILGSLLSSDCTFLLGIKCSNLGQYLSRQMSALSYNHFPLFLSFEEDEDSITFEEFVNCILVIGSARECRIKTLKSIGQSHSALVSYLETLSCASRYFPYSMQSSLQYVQKILLSQLGFNIVAMCKEKANVMSLEELDRHVALASACLTFGINTDATSVRLKLCGLGIEFGNHNLTEISLRHINDNLMKCLFFVSIEEGFISYYDMNVFRRDRYNIEELLQTLFSYSVVYLPSEMSICPKPLRMEMFRSVGAPLDLRTDIEFWFDLGVIDPRMCLLFFQYLNFSGQGKVRHKQIAIEYMAQFVFEKQYILHLDTAFNLLGYSLMKENKLPISFICFVKSLIIRPYHNAAKFYLAILFNKINAINRGNTLHESRCNMCRCNIL